MASDLSGLSADTNIYSALALEKHLPRIPLSNLHPNTQYDDLGAKELQMPNFSPTPPPKQLKHRKSAKHLIHHFESMSQDSVTVSSSASKVRSAIGKSSNHIQPPTDESVQNKKSPLRKSLQNIFTALRKGRISHAGPSTSPAQKLSNQKSPSHAPIVHQDCSVAEDTIHSPTAASTSQKQQLTDSLATKPYHDDELLYLARLPISDAALHSVWTHAKVSFGNSDLVVTQSSSQGHPCMSSIPLLHCTDVRSVSQDEILDDEWALLPSEVVESGEPCLLELLFEGRPREKFVAPTVRDRARWISAIWDAILKAQETKIPSSLGSIGSQKFRSKLVSERASDRPAPRTPSPAKANPTKTPNSGSHNGSNGLKPNFEKENNSSPVASPRSASIQNLGKRSMVRQRLAEIEKGRATSSPSPSRTSSAFPSLHDGISTTSKQTSNTSSSSSSPGPRSERIRVAFEKIEELARREVPGSQIMHNEGRTPEKSRTLETVLEEFDSPVASAPRSLSPGPYSTSSCYPATTSSEDESSSDPQEEYSHGPLISSPVETTDSSLVSHRAPAELASLLTNQQTFFEKHVSVLREDIQRVANHSAPFSELVVDIFKSMVLLGEALEKVEDIGLGGLEEIQGLKRLVTDVQNIQTDIHATNLSTKLQETKLDESLATILSKLEEIHTLNERNDTQGNGPLESKKVSVMKNIGPSVAENDDSSSCGDTSETSIQDIHRKLDQLQLAIKDHIAHVGTQIDSGTPIPPLDRTQLEEIVRLMKEQCESQESRVQADLVNRVGELNMQLTSFSGEGVPEMRSLVGVVRALLSELGARPESEGSSAMSGGLITELQHSLAVQQEEHHSLLNFKDAVNTLIEVVQEYIRSSGENRGGFDPESLRAITEMQRQGQEDLLRTLAHELTSEIRGERIRFVEAMKEATAINVANHVEQFKKELSREVMSMTQEVGRLHREKQAIEASIADLFAFYAKQRQNGPTVRMHPHPHSLPHPHPQPVRTGGPPHMPLPIYHPQLRQALPPQAATPRMAPSPSISHYPSTPHAPQPVFIRRSLPPVQE